MQRLRAVRDAPEYGVTDDAIAVAQTLTSTQRPEADAGLRVAAMSALRAFLQATAAQTGPDRAQHRWALACVAAMAPPAAAHTHVLLGPDGSQQLKQPDIQA